MDSRAIPDGRIFPATYLVEKYGVPPTSKPWHDRPDGEFLVEERIDEAAVLGEAGYETVAGAVEELVPELADKPHQLTEDLRPFLFGYSGNDCLLRAFKKQYSWGLDLEKQYQAARTFSQVFNLGAEDSLILTLMCMALRKRNHQILGQVDFFKQWSTMKFS